MLLVLENRYAVDTANGLGDLNVATHGGCGVKTVPRRDVSGSARDSNNWEPGSIMTDANPAGVITGARHEADGKLATPRIASGLSIKEREMKIAVRFALVFLFLVANTVANAQAPTRVRGTISAFDGAVLSVQDASGMNVTIQLGEKTELVFTQPLALAEIKPGDFLGVTSRKGADGTLTAYEVRRFPRPLNPGHRPLDGQEDQTMTNATVAVTVESTSGRELTLTYQGGSQKIVVPATASISTLVPGERSQLVPGAAVNLTATTVADGKLLAQRVQVSPRK